jgi:hypothetical protein
MNLRRKRYVDDNPLLVGGIAVAISRLTKEELVCSHF